MHEIPNAICCLESILDRLEKDKKIFLFIDYDGTLTKIRKKPHQALPGSELADFLNSEAFINNEKNTEFVFSIISGRPLADLVKILSTINKDNLNLVGSHGAEIMVAKNYKGRIICKFPPLLPDENIGKIKAIIKKYIENIRNIYLEEKPYSFAVHYRNISREDVPQIKIMLEMLKNLNSSYDFRYLEMKKVIEVMPKELDKGKIIPVIIDNFLVNWSDNSKYVAVCIGDDVTDEDLFRANADGINIKVGKDIDTDTTKAGYKLCDPAEVLYFIKAITNRAV